MLFSFFFFIPYLLRQVRKKSYAVTTRGIFWLRKCYDWLVFKKYPHLLSYTVKNVEMFYHEVICLIRDGSWVLVVLKSYIISKFRIFFEKLLFCVLILNFGYTQFNCSTKYYLFQCLIQVACSFVQRWVVGRNGMWGLPET